MSNMAFDHLPSPAAGLLQTARLQAGLSQRELARRAGVPASMVSAYERDKRQPTLATLIRLVRAAGFEPRIHLEPLNIADDSNGATSPLVDEPARMIWERQLREWRNAKPAI